jgi:hypothetical protein
MEKKSTRNTAVFLIILGLLIWWSSTQTNNQPQAPPTEYCTANTC